MVDNGDPLVIKCLGGQMQNIPRDRIKVVLNRADSKVGLDMREVEKTLQTKVNVTIPSSRDVPLSVNRGAPIALEDPRSSVARAIAELADQIEALKDAPKTTPKLLRLPLGRKKR